MGTAGSVAHLFRKVGVLSYEGGTDEDALTEAAIDAGADDVVVYPEDGAIDVLTAPDAYESVKAALAAAGHVPGHAEITMRAENDIAVAGDTALQVRKLLDMLNDLDDVQSVYSNAELGG
jgi:transcriptional/translational regulatory protein YebC/TACO1